MLVHEPRLVDKMLSSQMHDCLKRYINMILILFSYPRLDVSNGDEDSAALFKYLRRHFVLWSGQNVGKIFFSNTTYIHFKMFKVAQYMESLLLKKLHLFVTRKSLKHFVKLFVSNCLYQKHMFSKVIHFIIIFKRLRL